MNRHFNYLAEISKDNPHASELSLLNRLIPYLTVDAPLKSILREVIDWITDGLKVDRCTLFMHDPIYDELYTRSSMDEKMAEIRFSSKLGIAGEVFHSAKASIIPDAYADPRFNPAIDKKTGYRTKNIMSVPIFLVEDDAKKAIGVIQVLNKLDGDFEPEHLSWLERHLKVSSAFLQNAHLREALELSKKEEEQLLEVSTALNSELKLGPLLKLIMAQAATFLEADRSTLFLHDPSRKELWTAASQHDEMEKVRFPDHMGMAGHVFSTGEIIMLEDVYDDPRFNRDIDKQTGYRTKSMLCIPVYNQHQQVFAVAQVLNKRSGIFSSKDLRRLRAFASQAAVAIENAQLFDEVVEIKNYNESILRSMSNGIITFSDEGKVNKVNPAAEKMVGYNEDVHHCSETMFKGENRWIHQHIQEVLQKASSENMVDVEVSPIEGTDRDQAVSLNLNMVPLSDQKDRNVGCLMVMEDLSLEKRLKNTMARYMNKDVADRLLENGTEALGGKMQKATVLFTDIANFTTISEEAGPVKTVSMLNEYFSVMADQIMEQKGILDKYIGDAIMAVFGVPFEGEDDSDRAVKAALNMVAALKRFNEQRIQQNEDPIGMRIGVHSDVIISGNIGSEKRMDYTVIGDGVNLASRLESINRYYGTQLVISESTLHSMIQKPKCRMLDKIQVKGKREAVKIYEVFSDSDGHYSDSWLSQFEEARQLYDGGHFGDAQRLFENLNETCIDKTCQAYITRCRTLVANHPGPAWTGVYTMDQK